MDHSRFPFYLWPPCSVRTLAPIISIFGYLSSLLLWTQALMYLSPRTCPPHCPLDSNTPHWVVSAVDPAAVPPCMCPLHHILSDPLGRAPSSVGGPCQALRSHLDCPCTPVWGLLTQPHLCSHPAPRLTGSLGLELQPCAGSPPPHMPSSSIQVPTPQSGPHSYLFLSPYFELNCWGTERRKGAGLHVPFIIHFSSSTNRKQGFDWKCIDWLYEQTMEKRHLYYGAFQTINVLIIWLTLKF